MPEAKRALIIGSGSIATRHQSILSGMGFEVALVTKRASATDLKDKVFKSLENALVEFKPSYVVIASATVNHSEQLDYLIKCKFDGALLVEKPLFDAPHPLEKACFKTSAVGYQLRFHPALVALNNYLSGQKILSCHVYAGEYLPNWRPTRDYRETYSAKKALGGGPLRDLSHEIDYLMWLFGPVTKCHSIAGKFSSLQIDTEDTVGMLLSLRDCPVATMQLNYTDRLRRREIVINTDADSFFCDLLTGTLTTKTNGTQVFKVSGSDLIASMHRDILESNAKSCCSLEQGSAIVQLINSICP